MLILPLLRPVIAFSGLRRGNGKFFATLLGLTSVEPDRVLGLGPLPFLGENCSGDTLPAELADNRKGGLELTAHRQKEDRV